MVLMHDATLDRTTTGKGKLSDYTYEELKKFRLKDAGGQYYRLPHSHAFGGDRMGRVVKPSSNLDHKDVPLAMTAALIKKHKADAFVMLTVHSAAEMTYYLSQNKNHTFSAFVRNMKEYEDYEKAGVPFTQMIAYIGPHVKPENKELYALLNKKGTMCMISAASSYDKLKTAEERKAAYIAIAKDGASILESDYPIEAAAAVKEYTQKSSPKQKFFGKK